MTTQPTQTTLDYSLITPNTQNRVLARNLYKFLELRQADIARWLKTKIEKNSFAVENEDYWGFSTVAEGNQIQDFELTPNFAKKLAMMSKSKVGETVRDYFIARDNQLTKIESQPPKQLTPAEMMVAQAQLSLDLERRQTQMENQLQQLTTVVHSLETKQITQKETITKTNALTGEKAKIKAQKDDIGSEINYFIRQFATQKGITQIDQAHRLARAEYKTDTGNEYAGASNTSLESKQNYLTWLKSKNI